MGPPTAKFFGMELGWLGDMLLLSQSNYIEELSRKYPDLKTASTPLPPVLIVVEASPEPRPEDLAACQTMLGEISWLALEQGLMRPSR